MAIAEQMGYDATGRETPDQNDFPEILKQYKEFKPGSWRMGKSVEEYDCIASRCQSHRDEWEGQLDPYY